MPMENQQSMYKVLFFPRSFVLIKCKKMSLGGTIVYEAILATGTKPVITGRTNSQCNKQHIAID